MTVSIEDADDRTGRPEAAAQAPDGLVVVDLDGTLLRTDLLYECLLALVRQKPWLLLLLPFWLLQGKAAFKSRLADHVTLDIDSMPANEGLVEWLAGEKARGRRLALVSASDHRLVEQVAERFGLFDEVEGSDGTTNLAGAAKLAAIRTRGPEGITYIGDSHHDLVVWEGCGHAILAGHRAERLRARLSQTVRVAGEFPTARARLRTWAKALRLHQWAKNGLVFVAPLLAGLIGDPAAVGASLAAFLLFGLLASATYLVNDLLDLPADRRHRSKRLRPLAAGDLPIRDALLAAPVLLLGATLLLVLLPLKFMGVALLYLAVTLAYSLHVKRVPILDMIVLAGLFTIRILAGIVAVGTELTPWLLTFSMFFFLSLAGIKRFTECQLMAAEGRDRVAGRGYRPGDAPWLMAMGAASGFCSTLVFFIYLVDERSPMHQYNSPEWLWLICIVLGYWLGRAWLLALRGEMNDDPVLFALKDRLSLALAGIVAVTVALAHI